MIWKTRKKSKLKCERRWKIQRKVKLNSGKIGEMGGGGVGDGGGGGGSYWLSAPSSPFYFHYLRPIALLFSTN
jgi:hypothetical protein